MKNLVDFLKECGDGCCCSNFATPATTIGMGGVEPLSTDPIPMKKNIRRKKIRRRGTVKRQRS